MILVIFLYYTINISFLLMYFRKYRISPVFLFAFMQLFVFSSIIYFYNEKQSYTYYNFLMIIYLISIGCYILGVFAAGVTKIKYQKSNVSITTIDVKLSGYTKNVLIFIVVTAIIWNIFFFYKAGINVFLRSLFEFASGVELSNYKDERRNFTEMFGVGIVYQFRVILLPVINLFFLIQNNSKNLKRFGKCILPLTIIFLVGTGQRYGFIFFIFNSVVILYCLSYSYNYKLDKKLIVVLSLFAFAILSLLTLANGRAATDSSENAVSNMLQSIMERLFDETGTHITVGFEYIYNKGIIVYGQDWLCMLIEILPGKQTDYIPLDYQIFQYRFGSLNGTSAPGIWSSAYYNFSWLGFTLYPFLIGFLFQRIHKNYLKGNKSLLKIIIYYGLACFMGMWYCGAPTAFFNNGSVTILLLMIILFKVKISMKYKESNRKLFA